ncbi:hypothetical protein LEN26_002758 [Aphanomyces euteiches]|nr:hypothetical protein AeMF1_004487 [Aphanomyces euteiches]KAH9158736.1 hypothetical protein LEN26_002758 [Aphanomyces euteiches]KAH9185781.1 hypothetical protein AeNC1_012243 [Aphanomyces euteiches]
MNGMNLNQMGGMGMNMGSMNMGNMNPSMSHHPSMTGMMNQSGMGGQHQQHMSSMNNMNSMMGMAMGMNGSNPPNGSNPNGSMNPSSMNMGMGHNPMSHMSHQHSGQPHNPHMMGMNSMHSMSHQMGSIGNMPMGGNPMAGMHSMGGPMNPSAMGSQSSYAPSNVGFMPPSNNGQSIAQMEWRAQFTRDHRSNLIAKMYNEMVRVSTEPAGIALWINVAWFELKLYKECQTQEEYINKILKRLQQLKTQGGDMPNPSHTVGMVGGGGQHMPGMQNPNSSNGFMYGGGANQPPNLSINTNTAPGGGPGGFPPNNPNATPKQGNKPGSTTNKTGPPPNGAGAPGAPGNKPNGPNVPGNNNPNAGMMSRGQPHMQGPNGSGPPQVSSQNSPETIINTMAPNNPAEYWRQHGMIKAKFMNDVSTVHNAFKKYVDHMKDQNESEQKQKLTYLLGYVQLCASILEEDQATHPPRTIEELEKVNKYVVRIVHPYLKKLKAEKDRRTSSGNNTPQGHNNVMGFEMGGSNPAPGGRPGHGQPPSAGQGGQANMFQSMMQSSVPKPQPPMMMDDYGMGSGQMNMGQYQYPGGNSSSNGNGNGNPHMNMGFNMGNSYNMGSSDSNMMSNDMLSSMQGGGGGGGGNSNDMNFLDMDGSSFGMGDHGNSGQGSSNDDGDGGDLMNMVEAL